MRGFEQMPLKRYVPKSVRRLLTSGSNRLVLRLYGLLPEETRLHIASNAEIVRPMDYERAPIVLSIRSETEYVTRTHSCAKEPETVAWIENEFRPGDVFFDVGANVGAYSLVAAKAHQGKVKVFAFEPSFLNYSQLCKNLMLNDCGDIVSPIPFAISSASEMARFNYNEVATGAAINALGSPIDHKGQPFEPGFHHDIPSLSLDDFVRMFHLQTPSFLKIDVDGLELQVLRGAREMLARGTIRSILVEGSSGESEARLIELLGGYGYTQTSRHRRRESEFYNFIFHRNVGS